MSSSTSAKASSSAGPSNARNAIDEEAAVRRSARIAAKTEPQNSNRSVIKKSKKKEDSEPQGQRRNQRSARKKEETLAESSQPVEPAETSKATSAISAPSKNPPAKRSVSSDDDSEAVKKTRKSTRVTRSTGFKGQAVTTRSRMGAVLNKAEEAQTTRSSSEEEEPKVLEIKLRSGRRVAPAEEVVKDQANEGTTTKSLRSRSVRVNPTPVEVTKEDSQSKQIPTPPSVSQRAKKEKRQADKPAALVKKSSSASAKEVKGTGPASEQPAASATSTSNMAQNNPNRPFPGDHSSLASNIFSALGDFESLTGEEFDMQRLQSILEARGLPSGLFHSLGPRFQQMLGRIGTGGSSQCATKSNQLLTNLKGTDESAQLAAAAELCQMLVMGNEDTLHGFPVKPTVQALTGVIGGQHANYELISSSLRALTYMMESLPRSSTVIANNIPALLQKLQSIEVIDIAEQSLVALEMLSRRHAKQILRANGVQAVLSFIDFFSPVAQRNALLITSCCCSNLTKEEFEYLQPVIPQLSQRISADSDKKCVEYACAAFARMVECFQNDGDRLRDISSHGLLHNIQQLLQAGSGMLSSATFIMVLQMLSHICDACPDLAAHLLDNKIVGTLVLLLTGSGTSGQRLELSKSARSPQEGFELIRLINSLMPDLPSDGIFEVNTLLRKISGNGETLVAWFWKDDSNNWMPYTAAESLTIENAFRTNQEDVLIETQQAQYVIDLVAMHQINEDTGTSREVRRQELPPTVKRGGVQVSEPSADPNVPVFVEQIFPILYEVYSTSAGPAIRHKCSEALLKMTYHSNSELIYKLMKSLPISSNIASNLATADLKSVINAILLSDLLMQRLPDTFAVHLRREGVTYQMGMCAKGNSVVFRQPATDTPVVLQERISAEPLSAEVAQSSSTESNDVPPPKQYARRTGTKRLSQSTRRKEAGDGQEASPPNTGPDSAPSSASAGSSESTGTSHPFNRLAMARMKLATEGRAMFDRLSASLHSSGSSASSSAAAPGASPPLRQQALDWIKTNAQRFMDVYFPSLNTAQSAAMAVLTGAMDKLRTEKEITALKEIRQVILDGSASPFEVILSGVLKTLLKYLTDPDWPDDFDTEGSNKRIKRKVKYDGSVTQRKLRLIRFMHVFFDCPSEEDVENQFIDVYDLSDTIDSVPGFQALVMKVNACINQLEQFPVRVTDLSIPGGVGASGSRHPVMRAFAQSQLKCLLQRHPDAANLQQFRGGMVRVEPLAPIHTIERYLVSRGCARAVGPEDSSVDTDEISDEEELDTAAMAAEISRGNGRHRLELMLNNQVLPYNWSLYQCIRHFSRQGHGDDEGMDTELGAGQLALFAATHTIHYRLLTEENVNQAAVEPAEGARSASLSKGKGEKRSSAENSGIKELDSPLESYLSAVKHPDYLTVKDASLDAIVLQKVLYGMNHYWPDVYQPQSKPMPHLGEMDFHNSKLVVKLNRQLQDPVMVLTGQTPLWMSQIATYAPFLFPFESRLQLFYITAFDRDRAMQRLLDTNPELASSNRNAQSSSSSSHDQTAPRIERRKRTVSRKNLLVQTQTIMDEYSQSRQFLEIQYQDEVGTGLGPTLEYYSLVSKEFQRADLNLWHVPSDHRTTGVHVYAPCGLYPRPLGRNTKAKVTEVEEKFRLLGKFMAKALMDFRMVDITFSPVFYKWLLRQESQLGLADLAHIDPELAKHMDKMCRIARRKKWLETHDTDPKRENNDSELLYDGTPVEELYLSFTLPGYEDIELCKGGRDKVVSLDNIEQFVKQVTAAYLHESVSRQMEAFREAFNSVAPVKHLQMFRAEELDRVFCGHGEHSEEGWDSKTLLEACHPDHGYNNESQAIKWLYSIMSSFNSAQRREFVQFVTGSPKLPVGGFKALNPPFTIVKKTVPGDHNMDQYLPSVMTCVNYLKLPDYTSMEVMKSRLETACKEGQHAFHLS